MKNILSSLTAFLLLLGATQGYAQNPLSSANGFSVFVKNNLSLGNTNVSKAVATGGNFKVGGTIGDVSAGTYTVGSTTAALVVGGSLDWTGSNTVIKNGYAKIGNCAGTTTVWYTDPQNSNNPVQINQGPNYYSCCPYIQFNNHSAASFGGVSAVNNPICASTGINFNTDFTQLEANAAGMAANQNNVTLKYNGLTLSIGSILSLGIITSQVDITLAPGVNFLNLTGAQLNALQSINITNGVDATRTLIINVNEPGSFSWNVQTINGNVDPAYMLYNFSNTTTLTISSGQNIKGTLFAPKADVTKTVYNDIQGQVVAKSFTGLGNNIQGAYFNNNSVPGGNGAASATVAGFSINSNTQCLSGNGFSFTNSSTGSGTLTYKWSFGDGTSSTSASPTKNYTAAGTYSVKLVTTGSGGKDSITKSVTVNAQPATGFTVNNAAQNLSGNSFTFTSSNVSAGNSYAWKFRDNGATGSGANATRAFSGVGVYDVTQIVTSSAGCKDSSSQRITVRAGSCSPTEPAWGFNVFVRNNANLIAPHTEGGVAAGGNLIIGGGYQTALNSIGTFRANGVPVSLLVGGRIDASSTSGSLFQVLTGTIAKIGDSTGYDVWYKDPNNAYSPIRIAPDGNYSGTPRIDFSSTANAFTPELSATENPVFQSNLIDFAAEFVKLKSYSTNLASYTNNVTLYTSSNLNTSYPGNSVSANGQVYVSLANGINVLNLTGANLNNFQSLTFQGGAPSANKILVVNVDAPGTFNWNVTNSTGAGPTDGQYILYNFPNTTQLNIQGGSAVLGTVFAPYSDIDKTVNQGNIDGQIIGQSYKHNGGEDHPQYFNSSLLNMCVQPVIASFTVNNQAQCLGGNNFQFTSNATGVAPLTYKWSFGDNTSSTTANPSHTYAAAGSYTVKLVVTDNNGTKDSTTKTVIVNTAPIATFGVNAAAQLLLGNNFAFTANSQIAGNTYLWTLGDGTTSTSANITGKTYGTAGTYTVKLVVTNVNGCKDSSTQIVTVGLNPTVALPGISLPTQCLVGNSFVFTNASVGIPPLSYFWDFGDGTTSTLPLPVKAYAAAGVYNVKLVVTSGLGGKDSSLVAVTVAAPPIPLFTVNASAQVLGSNSFNLAAAAQVSGNTYLWNLGDGTTSTSASITGKVYTAPGNYTVKLVVTNANGCKDSSTQVVIVLPNGPTVSASVNLGAQCLVGNSFVFANASIGTGLLNYFWDFGDGTTSTLANPVKVYAAAGVYPVKLVVADINGLKDSITLNATVHAQPLPSFTVNANAQLFAGNSFNFLPTVQAAGNVYLWNFGDGTTSAAASITGKVYTAPGTYNVKLVITNANGCKDSSTQVVIITPNPLPTVSATVNLGAQCLVGNSFVFANASVGTGLLNYFWDFGDGTTSTLANPIKVYAAAGVYPVKLVVTDAIGLKDSLTLNATVHAQPLPSFTVNASTQVLLNNNFNFAANAQVAGNIYFWDFGDGTTSASASITGKVYTAAGTYNVKLVVTSANSCKDSSTVIVIVNPNPTAAPTAGFTVNDPTQCLTGNSFAFTSTSTGSNLTYNWNFGDGTSSSQENPMHTYANAGSYIVVLTVTNGAGSAHTQQTVTVYPAATAGFTVSPSATQYLTGNAFTFTSSNPQAGNSYAWDFGDGMTETSENTTHSYTVAGPYTVRQIVTNANGCKDTASQNINVLSDSVSSGNNGGLESEGLGGLVTRRDYNRLKYSVNKAFDVMNAPLFDVPLYASKGAAAVQELADMMPANLAAGDVPRISTPTDLTALTIAKEALSVDYTRKNVTKASVLGIQTQGRAYNHTKSICDRFKGGIILNIQQTNVRGFDFSRYAIRQANGIVEYAIAFAAGKKTGDAAYRLQTGWVISRYAKDDTVYNFQVWATAPADVDKLAGDILDKLSSVRPLSVVRSADNLPAAYITKGVRHKDTLLLTLRNTTGIANGQVSFEERTNELAGQQSRVLPVTYKANGDATVAVPIGDGYEYEGLLYLGDSLVDQVYLADGNWGLDYDQSLTSVKVYEPTNNPTRIYKDDELPVYRSVNLTAVSDDYITLYKALLPGTEPLDLTDYHTLKFHATGNGAVTIRMTRDSITSWPAQYKTTTMMVQEGKDYEIAFEDFVSDKLSAPFYPKDVKTLDFTMEAGGQKAQFDLKLENVAFAKKKSASLLALQSKAISVAPNPIKGPFTVTYASDAARNLTLAVSDISGRVLYSQSVDAVVGANTVTVDLKGDFPTGTVLFVSLRGSDDTKYETTKVSTQ